MTTPAEVAFPAGRLSRVGHFLAERLETVLRRANLWLLAAFSIAYFTCTMLLACRKPLWHDELFTWHLGRLPRLGDLWSALAEGTDLNPPLSFLATRLAQTVLGDSAWAGRLPAVIGFWVMSLCLFRFVSRRCTLLYAWIALLLPLATVAYPFAYEARPYGLMLGCCGLSLVCWQAAAEGRRRLVLAGLALSLGAALGTHYYAIFLFVPLVLGEVVRSWTRRRVDWPVWTAIGAGALPLALLWPLIAAARTFPGTFWAPAAWDAVQPTYLALVLPLKTPLLLAMVVLPFYPEQGQGRTDFQSVPQSGVNGPLLHEMAAAFGFATLPTLAVVLGKWVTGVFTFRYILPVVVGLSLLVAFVSYRRSRGCIILGTALLACLLNVAVLQGSRDYRRLAQESARIEATCDYLRQHSSIELPIVVGAPIRFLEMVHYAPPELAARLVCVSDPAASVRYLHEDTTERALRHLRHWAPVSVVDCDAFLAEHREFLLYDNGGWLRRGLQAAGARLEECGRVQDAILYLVQVDRGALQAVARLGG
jgi:hypothetical protein